MKPIRTLALTLLLTALSATSALSQQMIGTTGGLNIPTAEMKPSGTFVGGINYISEGMLVGEAITHHDDCWAFNYNTGLYYLDFTVFPWLEVSFRQTMLRSRYTQMGDVLDDYEYQRTDRSISVRVQPLREGKYWPSIVIGANDPWKDTGHNIYASAYAVASKHLHVAPIASDFMLTVGYIHNLNNSRMYKGVFAGLKYTPDFCPEASLLVEYDTQGVNVGLQARLFRHLGLYAFTREFSDFNCGIRYEYTIKY